VLAAVGASDLGEVDFLHHHAQYKAGKMVLRHEVLHRRRQKQRLIDLPGAERFAHAHRQNPTRTSLARKIRLLLGQARPSIARPTAKSNSAPRFISPLDWIGLSPRCATMESPSNISRRPQRGPQLCTALGNGILLAKYLGGRCQEDVPVDVAAKPKGIRVDPRTASAAVTSKEPDANPLK
jgi:hypothetical protein